VGGVERAELLTYLGDWTRGGGSLTGRLADAIGRAVRRGDLPPGTRLPAERVLAGTLAVSRGTVVGAYERLRTEGVLAARQGSGTWVRPDAARPVQTLNDATGRAVPARRLAGGLVAARDGVIDLATSAVSTLDGVPPEVLTLPDAAMLGRLSGHGYLPLGLPALRNAVAAGFEPRTEAEQVIITGGGQQAIALVRDLVLRPGDTVVVEGPTYPGALDLFGRAGARIRTAPPGDPAALRGLVRAHGARLVYVMPACHNPLGHPMPTAHRRALAKLADQEQVYVLEDNVLDGLVYDGSHEPPIAAYSDRVLSAGSLGKIAWGGLRIGWLRGPTDLVDRLGRLKGAADFGLSIPSQVIACAVLARLPEIAAHRRALLRERRDLTQALLRRHLPDWRWEEPRGGLSLWVRLPAGDADDLGQRALRHGVDITPGSAHGAGHEHLDHLRVSYGQPPDVLREGIRRLAAAWWANPGAIGSVPPGPRVAASEP
jgi:DNA-binding transcriptional MocR family regulator